MGTVALTSGKAAFTTSTLTTGSHSITVTYNGSTGFNPSTSAVLTQSVN
jgi:archaellum component FlaF (FlaF/FlaG flagellin family)